MGYGDDIMATAEAREIKKKYPNSIIVFGNGKKVFTSEIFENNPNIYNKKEINYKDNVIWIDNYLGHRPTVDLTKKTNEKKIFWNKKFSPQKGDIFFSGMEIDIAKKVTEKSRKIWKQHFNKTPKALIVVEPGVKSAQYQKTSGTKIIGRSNLNRDWGFDKWQNVVNKFKNECIFIQTFKGKSKKLNGVFDVDCNFRIAAAIMSFSNLFIGNHGGFSHAAAALNIDAINVFGGWVSPSITGYDNHTNLYIDSSESPCGSKLECEHCKKCMEKITIDDVSNAVEKFIY